MAQGQIQTQTAEQALKQQQTVTQQQLLQAHLTELPLNQLIERIEVEMDDNPALEAMPVDDDATETDSDKGGTEDEETEDPLYSAFGDDDDELPVYVPNNGSTDREEIVYGANKSFYDSLKEQIGEIELSAQERDIMEYIIGSLDDDGLLRKSADAIADELAIYNNIYVEARDIECVIGMLQQFDPAGIGARSLQECLLLQIDRKEPSVVKDRMRQVVETFFDDFTHKRWDLVKRQMTLSDEEAHEMWAEMKKLNPKPGSAMSETIGKSLHHITPDFIIDTGDGGEISFALNEGGLPQLHISETFADMMKQGQKGGPVSRQMKEALIYSKKKVEDAQNFIEAIKTRRRTLTHTMRAIISWQRPFFEDGDEASLRPMRLRDIAEKTGLDISTVSRVSNSKYAETRWGIFPLKFFFTEGYTTGSGEELSTRQIKIALKEIVEAEDKSAPLSDEALATLLAKKGYPIARRTVAKYREQQGIPTARMRKN